MVHMTVNTALLFIICAVVIFMAAYKLGYDSIKKK